jgi:hypothetical protein
VDERTRELERQAAQGDPAARARLLSERLRQGSLAALSLERAAWLGDPQARAVLGEGAPAEELGLNALFFGLWSKEAGGRALAALARAALPWWEEVFPAASQPRECLDSLDELVAAPGHSAAALDAAREALDWTRERVVLVRLTVNDATTQRLPTLAEVERKAQETARLEAWRGALSALVLDGEAALALVEGELAGPRGEASLHTLVATAFDRPLRAVGLLLDAAHLVTYDLPDDPQDAEDSEGALRSWLNLARLTGQPVVRTLGTRESRAAIRAALVPWLLAPG